MIIMLLRYFFGYVSFRITGEFPERLLNQLAAAEIPVWNMRRKNGAITACMRVKDYLNIREIRGRNRVKTQVVGRFGLPFLIKRYKYRAGFAAGLVIYVATLFFLSSFVWNVEITGNSTIPTEKIVAVCQKLGLSEGAKKASLDAELIRTRLALELDNIAWASVNIEGVKATVNISESLETEKTDRSPCNLVAVRDGVVTAIEVTEGSIKTAVGRTVRKGEMLVSGITEYKDKTAVFGPSTGTVIAETDREIVCFVPFVKTETTVVGKPVSRCVLSLFGLRIPLYLGSVGGEYTTESEQWRYSANSMYLPVSVTKTVFTPTEKREYIMNEDEAKAAAEKKLAKLAEDELGDAEILASEQSFEVLLDGVKAVGNYRCKENIALKDFLLIYEEK